MQAVCLRATTKVATMTRGEGFKMKSRIRNMARCGAATAVLAALTACGGGESGPATPPPPATYTVGGTVTGLTGSGLFLGAGFGNALPVSAAGAFTFGTRVLSGTTYSVFVAAQPSSPTQYCSVANASGTVAAANVTSVSVTCGIGYTVGGTVWGLVGSGLEIEASRRGHGRTILIGNPLEINSNGPFTFDPVYNTSLVTAVGIAHQPASPTQLCVVNNAQVIFQAPNVTDVEVVCSQFRSEE